MTTPPRPAQDPHPTLGTDTLEDARLRPFEIMTDVRLTNLRLDDLLDRVRELTATDTAAVLLVDPSRRFLVATAARGLEAEVRQGVRIPLRRGFAGRIAEEQRPLVLSEFDDRSVVNPILRAAGIRSLLGVPLAWASAWSCQPAATSGSPPSTRCSGCPRCATWPRCPAPAAVHRSKLDEFATRRRG